MEDENTNMTLPVNKSPALSFSSWIDMKCGKDASRKQKLQSCLFLRTVVLISAALIIVCVTFVTSYKQRISEWVLADATQDNILNICQTQHRPYGSESLPRGIVTATTELEMRPLWGDYEKNSNPMNLLAMAVGIKQKMSVDKIVKKFPSSDFVVMLFHYDGKVDEWGDVEWSRHAIHVSAMNQTKWWFAKRFLHPDIVAEYEYIFLWDEDLGVENFDVRRYLTIIKEEALEISQPALDPRRSQVHHLLTARQINSTVHRRANMKIGSSWCHKKITGPPCSGFVEMMAPVFSKASWRCAWYMIQNDLVHGWGVDFQLGYCAQGDRTKNIGIVDSEYIIHQGLPTLGGSAEDKGKPLSYQSNSRSMVIKWSYKELDVFKSRWRKAVNEDDCWIDPY